MWKYWLRNLGLFGLIVEQQKRSLSFLINDGLFSFTLRFSTSLGNQFQYIWIDSRRKKGNRGGHSTIWSSRTLSNNKFYWLQRQDFTTVLVPKLKRHHTPSAPSEQRNFVPFWHCLFKSNLFSSSFEIKINRFILTPSLHRAVGGEKDQTTFFCGKRKAN